MTNQLSVFNFRSTEVRTVVVDGEAWFVASDVAKALKYRNADDMTRMLDDDEKGTHIVRTPSGEQEMIVINESGMYHAVLKSRKPEAKPFRKWVTSEVLPAIRKTGKYEAAPYAVNPGDTLTREEADHLRGLITSHAETLPREHRAGFVIRAWSKLKAHYKVPYRQIPQAEFSEAVCLIGRHIAEGEYLPRERALPAPSVDPALLEAARAELTRPGVRFLTAFSKSADGPMPVLMAIPDKALILTPEEFIEQVGRRFPEHLLPKLIHAAAGRMAQIA